VTSKVLEYLEGGISPFRRWFDALDAPAAARVTTALYRIEQGHRGNVKSVGEGVFEYKIDFGPGYRIYIGREGQKIIILIGGGSKKTQARDIKIAKDRWVSYKKRRSKP
jgi:putative addiction module killer protein